ncbi:MAG: hypothetical protein ACFFCW_47530 [Candidatus Hodarchaeota archaeon]
MSAEYDYWARKAGKMDKKTGIIREGTVITVDKFDFPQLHGKENPEIFIANTKPGEIEGIYSSSFLRLGGFDVMGSDGKIYHVKLKKR